MIELDTTILAVTRTIVLVLGLSIAFLSYRAYRRTRLTYLRNAAIGFAVVSLGVFLEGILYEVLRWDLVTVHIIESLIVAIGFAILLISLLR